jgi:DNA-binding transcriptional MerR regulator
MDLFFQRDIGQELDEEWILLMQTAQKMGISIEEVRMYIDHSKDQKTIHQKESLSVIKDICVHS